MKRRSARVRLHDPFIAPGFGTQKDLVNLATQLSTGNSTQLTADDVLEIMKRRGRGVDVDTTNDAAAAPASNAWADFMMEEGVTVEETTTTSAPDASTKRAYKLATKQQADTNKKQKPSTGILLQCGTLDSSVVGRTRIQDTAAYHLPIPTSIAPKIKVSRVFTGCNAAHSILTDEAGHAYGWGRNEIGQLGDKLNDEVVLPSKLDLPPIQMAACGKSHTIFLMVDGTCMAVGANKVGQCGIKIASDIVPSFKECHFDTEGLKIVQVACGEDFSMALDSEGRLYSTGSSEYGQLGSGETGEYFITANKLAFANSLIFTRRSTFCHAPGEKIHGAGDSSDKVVPLDEDIRLASIACGKHHTVAVEAMSDQRARIFSWGCGNYGCLGHGVQKDEYYPRMIAALAHLPTDSELDVQAGSTCSLIRVVSNGHLYYWGKHKQNSEATMRPQLVDALANNQHHVTHCAAGGQTVVCTTELGQTISYGQGPHGELGLGEKKSSSKPAFVESLQNKIIDDVACGYGHTLFVLREKSSKVPELKDSDVASLIKSAEAKGMQKRI